MQPVNIYNCNTNCNSDCKKRNTQNNDGCQCSKHKIYCFKNGKRYGQEESSPTRSIECISLTATETTLVPFIRKKQSVNNRKSTTEVISSTDSQEKVREKLFFPTNQDSSIRNEEHFKTTLKINPINAPTSNTQVIRTYDGSSTTRSSSRPASDIHIQQTNIQ